MKWSPKTRQKQGDLSGLTVEQLLRVIAQQEQRIDEQTVSLSGQNKTIKNHAARTTLLEEKLRLATIQKFAAKSEKLTYQIDLFDEAELDLAIADITAQLPDEPVPAANTKKKRKRGFSDSLTRVRVELTLTDAEKEGALRTFFTKVKEELEYIPAKQWLDQNAHKVVKDSKTRLAMDYALNQWHTLTGYCDDGYLNISNVLAENAIRPFAIGRKAWLFADTTRGANASATCYSLIETAKANNLEPYAYILHLLKLPWNAPQAILQK